MALSDQRGSSIRAVCEMLSSQGKSPVLIDCEAFIEKNPHVPKFPTMLPGDMTLILVNLAKQADAIRQEVSAVCLTVAEYQTFFPKISAYTDINKQQKWTTTTVVHGQSTADLITHVRVNVFFSKPLVSGKVHVKLNMNLNTTSTGEPAVDVQDNSTRISSPEFECQFHFAMPIVATPFSQYGIEVVIDGMTEDEARFLSLAVKREMRVIDFVDEKYRKTILQNPVLWKMGSNYIMSYQGRITSLPEIHNLDDEETAALTLLAPSLLLTSQ